MFCSSLWKMPYNQPKIPLKNCASCRGRACPARSLPPYPVSPSPPCRGRACPARSLPQYPFYGSIRRGGIHPSRAPPPPQTATAARGLAALHPHIKPVRRAGCPHPAAVYRHIPFPHRRPVGAGHARPAAYRNIPFTVQFVGEGFIPPGHPHRRKRPRRPEGWPPYTPTSNPCVGRGALTPPKPAAPYMHRLYISPNLFIFL